MTPTPADVMRPAAHREENEAYYRAVVAAGRAPSAHNAQPWRWRVSHGALDLFADHDRMTGRAGPDERLVAISCGAALHHARLTLAARGWRVVVTRLPDADQHHLARLRIDGPAPVSPDTAALARAIRHRRTDSRPVTGTPVEPESLRPIAAAFEAQQVGFSVLRPDQILGLAAATAPTRAGEDEASDVQWHAELALWTGDGRIVGGVDDRRTPAGTQSDHARAATFAVVHGPGDDLLDWLHAGEALSAGSLVATGLGVSVLPFSAPIEHVGAGTILRDAVAELGHPYLMMRLGRHATEADGPATTRLEAGRTMNIG